MGLLLKRTQRAPLDNCESRECNDRGLASGEEEESKDDSDLDQPGKEIDTAEARFWTGKKGGEFRRQGMGVVGDVESAMCVAVAGWYPEQGVHLQARTDTEHQTGGTGRHDVEPEKV